MHKEITPIFGSRKVILQQSKRSVTAFGGISVFFEFLGKLGYAQKVAEHMPFQLKSPNAIDPAHTFTAFIVSVLIGAPSPIPLQHPQRWSQPFQNRLLVLLGEA